MRAKILVSYVCLSSLVTACSEDSPEEQTLSGAPALTGDAALNTSDAASFDAYVPPALQGFDATSNSTTGEGGAASGDASVSASDDASTTGDSSTQEPPISADCLDGVTDYKTKGKFTYTAETSGQVKMWVPKVPAGCKVPVVHLANGTTANCGNYRPILEHLASHGFYAVCYEDPNTGQGTQCITALETAIQKHPELADDKIGSTGHSQGGGAAFMCLTRAEEKWGNAKIYAGHSMEPASGYGDSPSNWASYYAKIKSPMFMFNGTDDVLVSASWVQDAFNAMDDSTETYWYEATGAAHIPVPTSWTQESTVVWFRWKLLGDKKACEYFKNMPMGNQWDLKKKQAEKGC